MVVFNLFLPKAGQTIVWHTLTGSSAGLLIAQAAQQYPGLVLVVTPDMNSLYQIENALKFYAPAIPLLTFPDWETLPYDIHSPHQDIISQRLATLYQLPLTRRGLLVVPVSTLMQYLPPRDYLVGGGLVLTVGDELHLDTLCQHLESSAYQRVPQVTVHGEMAVRGAIIDIFPMGSDAPYRIELLDNTIDSIRTFDPDTQRTLNKIARIRFLPAREFPLDKPAIERFRQRYRAQFPSSAKALQQQVIYRDVSKGLIPSGIEYYLPLFFTQTATLFDYLPAQSLLVTLGDVEQAVLQFSTQLQSRYELRAQDLDRPILPPEQLYLSLAATQQALRPLPHLRLYSTPQPDAGSAMTLPLADLPCVLTNPRAKQPFQPLQQWVHDYPGRIAFTAHSAGRREALRELLQNAQINITDCTSWPDFVQGTLKYALLIAPLDHGLCLTEPPLAIITEEQLLGQKAWQQRRLPKTARHEAEAIIGYLAELQIGDPIVHRDHGVGRYHGLQNLALNGVEAEFLVIHYAQDNKLYVPTTALHLVSRYSGALAEQAPLHKLGNDQWQRLKQKAAEQIRDTAAELLDLYAQRAARQGFAFPAPDQDYQAFANEFPFTETPDQAAAIASVVQDLMSPRPMDRVICGDVGFGKTEVALRAAFVAVQGGKQVALLVPTTLLAQQHYQTFSDRFAHWPFKIEVLSRFRSAKQTDSVLQALAEGKVDIVIGTHKLLQPSVRFKALGLVIIDEEHRFGVQQKERLKALRTEVAILAMTATPIPRTLNMALSGIRDLSVIATPPAHRHAIKTSVVERSRAVIHEACLREIKRGGQVYFLHNRVESIQTVADELAQWLPEATIRLAHGQMREQELERIMLDFYHRRFNILVCTTIIESGIDVPSANTILIDRADTFGLAQLHQLRGRVGRSHHRAYAYLMIPPAQAISAEAAKRLAAIESSEQLGAGFTLASHDLEIRGAGELLGHEQSGQIQEIGFSLYSELLAQAVNALKVGQSIHTVTAVSPEITEIDLQIPALLPADYIADVHTRLVFYKRIAMADAAGLKELQIELIDRFGLLPVATQQLFAVTEIKLQATALGILKWVWQGPTGKIVFSAQPKINTTKLVELLKTQPARYQLSGKNTLQYQIAASTPAQKIAVVHELLQQFT